MAMGAKAPLGTLHYVPEAIYKAEKALVAARFNGLILNASKFDPDKDAKKPDFLSKNPLGKVPFLETEKGVIFTSNSIARYVARCRSDTSLYGKCVADEGDIDSWLEFCTHELEVPLMTLVYPTLGLLEEIPQVAQAAKADTKKALDRLEAALKASPYLLGDYVSLADVVVVCALKEGFTRVLEPAFRKPFPKVCAWFECCCAQPQFKAVLGDLKLCTVAAKPVPVKIVAKAAEAPKGGKSSAKQEEKKPQEAKKKEEKPAAKSSPKAAPKAKAAAAAAGGGSAAEIEAKILSVGDQIRTLKEKLKAEGLSGKKINDHEEIKKLVAELQDHKSKLPADGGAAAPAAPAAKKAASPKQSPKQAPAAAPSGGGGDLDAQIKAVGDEIRLLKEKLKGQGLSGKKVNDHDEVKALVAKLTELKSKQ